MISFPLDTINQTLQSINSSETVQNFKEQLNDHPLFFKPEAIRIEDLANEKLGSLKQLYSLKENLTATSSSYKVLEKKEGAFYKINCLFSFIFSASFRHQQKEFNANLKQLNHFQKTVQQTIVTLEKDGKSQFDKAQTNFMKKRKTFETKLKKQFIDVPSEEVYNQLKQTKKDQCLLKFITYWTTYHSPEFNTFMDTFQEDYGKQTTSEQKIDCLETYLLKEIKKTTFYKFIKKELDQEEDEKSLMVMFLLKSPNIDLHLRVFSSSQILNRKKTAELLESALDYIRGNAVVED